MMQPECEIPYVSDQLLRYKFGKVADIAELLINGRRLARLENLGNNILYKEEQEQATENTRRVG